jgi:hypothetical protein
MRRLPRDPVKFDLLQIIAGRIRTRGDRIQDPVAAAEVFRELQSSYVRGQSDQKLFHGQRTEVLFAYVAAALGRCQLIKSEDSGEVYSTQGDLRVPDYRLVTREGRQLLVEVKNLHAPDPQRLFKIRATDLRGLQQYASTCGCELFLAIYWSSWKQWTLIQPSDLQVKGKMFTITLPQALARNHMALLGDRSIGTLPSLSLRLISSPEDDQTTPEPGQYLFTIRDTQLYCGEQLITEPIEQRIAWFLMTNTDWAAIQVPEMDGSCLAAITFVITPRERANPQEQFEIIGRLSDLVSRQFDAATVTDGQIINIAPGAEPEGFGVAIPPDYRGTALPLLQLEQWVADGSGNARAP